MRFPTVLLLTMALTCVATGWASAEMRSIEVAGGESELTLVQQSPDALEYRVRVGELAAMDVTSPEGEFTRLLIPGFHSSHIEGSPELPMMNRLIEVPYGANARVEVLLAQSREYDLTALGITNPVMPAQPSMPKNVDPAHWPFVIDRDAYEQHRVSQELAAVSPQGQLRAVQIGRLEISPVEYYPQENRLVVYEELTLRVVFDGADHAAGDALKARTNSVFFEPLYERFDGYRGLHDNYPDRVGEIVTMVVVAPPEFEAQLAEYVDWKTERGFHTILAITGTPEVGTTTSSIQAYIHDLYNNASPELPAPSFVVFVGDVAQMPTWQQSGDATDRPYCAVDGDIVPDIYYGRLSATNSTMLANILEKTLMYDQFTMPDPSYLGEVCMIAGMDSGHGHVWGNGQINYGTDYYFNEAHGIYSHTYLYPESGSHASDIVQHVSDGVSYINYTAHGSQTSWSDPYFSQANINGLSNYGKYCLAVGNCCLTSTYDYGECFAETWLRAEDKGAIGYIGGSNSTYWDEDYWWGVGSGQIVTRPTYEDHGLGAYDGLFHDHGEAMTQWYIVNACLMFSGNIAVMEGGGSSTYYWNIYNLMGDPSISTYLGVPTAHSVVHPETIFTNWTAVTIEAEPNSYVGLTKDGELIGAGTVDESGSLDLEIWAEPLTPGVAHLVVMAQNLLPYAVDLNVIVPATITIDPEVINSNEETLITVSVFESDGVTPRPGVEIWADGLDYDAGHVFTDATGYCSFTVNYPYGPSLDIVGQEPGEAYELFRNAIEVVAVPLFGVGLSVTTEIGLSNQFALNLPGTLHASVMEPGHTLWAFLNGEFVGSTTDYDLELTPMELGEVEGVIAVSGFDLFRRGFDVIEAYGTLSGHVDASGAPAAGAIVRGYDESMEQVFEATTNAQGDYAVSGDVLVASYTITCDHFGFLHWETPYFINYGENVLDIVMDPAPAGVLTGVVTEAGTGDPLAATIKVYRTDTDEEYAVTTTDLGTGEYTTPELPYFEYRVVAKAYRHIPVTIEVTIDQPTVTRDFELEETEGDLLLIDDTAADRYHPEEIDPQTGLVLKPAYYSEPTKSVDDIAADLEAIGYNCTVETMSVTDPGTWSTHDIVMTCSGANTVTLSDASFRSDLITFAQGGGRIFIEGGEVGYDHYGDTNFASNVLHINDWNHDESGSVTVAEPTHYVMSVPNVIIGPITVGYSGWGDQDALVPTADAVKVGSWTSYPTDASLVCYDDNENPAGGQIVFFAFNYAVMDTEARVQLLQNAVSWLLTDDEISAADDDAEPLILMLEGSVPNPMQSSTAVRFSLPQPTDIDLGVFDVAGRRVATLARGEHGVGSHLIVWDGLESTGQPAPNAAYFFRLKTPEATLSKKVMVVR